MILLEPKDLDKFIDEDKKMNPQVEQIISLIFENTDPRLVIDEAKFSSKWNDNLNKFKEDEDLVSVSMYINNQPKGRTRFYSTIDLKRNLMFINGVHPYDLTDYFYAYSEYSEYDDSFNLWRFVDSKTRKIVGKPMHINDIYEVCLKLRELDSTKKAHIDTN